MIKIVLLWALLNLVGMIRRFQFERQPQNTTNSFCHWIPPQRQGGGGGGGGREKSVTNNLLAQDLNLDILCKKTFQSKNFTFILKDAFSLIDCGYAFQSLRPPCFRYGD